MTKLEKGRKGCSSTSRDATLTSNGQTTVPKEIRDSLQMKEGDRIMFTLLPDGTVLMRVKSKRDAEAVWRVALEW